MAQSLSIISFTTPHPVLGFEREAELTDITINVREIALELTVFYLENGSRIENTSLNNPKYVLRATPDSEVYRDSRTGAMMDEMTDYDDSPYLVQEYQLFMMMLTQPVKILEMAANIVLEYEQLGRYDA